MNKITNRTLAAALAVSLTFATGTIALADRGGHGHGHAGARASEHGNSERGNRNSEHGNREHDNDNRGNSATAHSCINPAGNMRGWCKSHVGNDLMTGTVTSINGNTATVMLSNGQSVTVNSAGLTVGQRVTLRGSFQNGTFVVNGRPLSNFGGPFSGTSIRGTIVSVNGNSIQLLQGLSLITVDDSNAAARGAINGTLLPGRSITAFGNWNGSTFVANSIQ